MRAKYTFCFLVAVIFFIFPGVSHAITLEEALNKALTNNLQILLEKEKLKEAEKAKEEAFAGYFPNLALRGSHTHLGELPSIPNPLYPHYGPEKIKVGEQDTTSFTLSVTQPVYTGGQLTLANRQANLNYQSAKERLSQTQTEIIFQVKQAFYSVILAEKNLEITEKALHQAEAHLEVVESFYRSGRISRFDFLRARVEVANLKPDLTYAKNNLDLVRERLATLLSVDSALLKVTGELEFELLDLTLNEAMESAYLFRGDLKALKIQREMAKVSVDSARARNLPSVSFVANYEYTSGGTGGWEDSWNASLVLSFPLFDGGKNRAFVEQRESQVRQIALAISQLQDAIKLEVKKAFLDMQTAKESLFAQEQNIQQAEEALSIAEARYKIGTITQIEVLDAQLALTRAKLGYTKALYDYNIAKASLMKAKGG
ncbi:TolC family protein [Candidatus Aerophobetes bacterium]|nr:TolC family protein [Candidatus Aerophobetes bacterium]